MWYLLCFVLLGSTRLCPAANYTCSNRPLVIQEELVSDLLWHLDTHRSVRMDGIHPKDMQGAGRRTHQDTLHHLHYQSWLSGEVPGDYRLTSVTPICKRGWEEDQACQLDLSVGKVMEEITSSVTTQYRTRGSGPARGSGKPGPAWPT